MCLDAVVPAYRDRLQQRMMFSSAWHQSMTAALVGEEHLESQCVLCRGHLADQHGERHADAAWTWPAPAAALPAGISAIRERTSDNGTVFGEGLQ
jgi:hypothetical protein